jgi:cytochrome b involved in lipid metabolism
MVVFCLSLMLMGFTSAQAHQPVILLDSDTSAAKGPLLVDGTISFAVRASFTKAGQKKAFRADFKDGDTLAVQYLIVDKKPENTVKTSLLPQLVMVSPSGKSVALKFTERSKFYEPYGKTNYLYLARVSSAAEAGTYNFTLSSRGKASVTIAVGDREVTGQVVRGVRTAASATPTPKSSATPKVSATPTPTPSPTVTKASYTMADVKAANTSSKCWSVIDGYVYDLTKFISSHRGGPSTIRFLCGIDGTNAFKAQHEGSSTAQAVLPNYLLGPLTP